MRQGERKVWCKYYKIYISYNMKAELNKPNIFQPSFARFGLVKNWQMSFRNKKKLRKMQIFHWKGNVLIQTSLTEFVFLILIYVYFFLHYFFLVKNPPISIFLNNYCNSSNRLIHLFLILKYILYFLNRSFRWIYLRNSQKEML